MAAIYPETKMPTVYLIVGARNSGGTSSDAGLLLGVEMYSTRSGQLLNPDDFVGLVTHELVHFQQKGSREVTLLRQAMLEGAADFIAERIAGRNGDERSKSYADGHEQELWDQFSAEMYSSNLNGWLYNGHSVKSGVPPDLGYYEGYKICQAFYEHAFDKAIALKRIMVLENEEDILKESSYASRFVGRDTH